MDHDISSTQYSSKNTTVFAAAVTLDQVSSLPVETESCFKKPWFNASSFQLSGSLVATAVHTPLVDSNAKDERDLPLSIVTQKLELATKGKRKKKKRSESKKRHKSEFKRMDIHFSEPLRKNSSYSDLSSESSSFSDNSADEITVPSKIGVGSIIVAEQLTSRDSRNFIWSLDRKGDRDITYFGSAYRLDLPSYDLMLGRNASGYITLISSDKMARDGYLLPSGVCYPSLQKKLSPGSAFFSKKNNDVVEKMDRRNRYFGSENIKQIFSLTLPRWRRSVFLRRRQSSYDTVKQKKAPVSAVGGSFLPFSVSVDESSLRDDSIPIFEREVVSDAEVKALYILFHLS